MASESQRSAEGQAYSDRTGPDLPVNLSLSFGSNGVTAVWDVPQGETAAAYNLYRSDIPIAYVSGLTPVTKVAITKAVDTAPQKAKRYYAVTALDDLGNEGPPSESKEITFPVAPVRNLTLEKIDEAAPRIAWQAPDDSNIIGYHIYRNGSLITQAPVIDLAYTDGYYASGTVTYGVSAINNLSNESPIKEVTLSDMSLGLKPGTVLRRGLIETVPVVVTTAITLSIDTISVKVGDAAESIIQGPFALEANSTLQLEKVASTTADAPPTVAALLKATWSPSPGVTVKITKTSAAAVIGSGTALEIFSDPLIRGTEAEVRLKVNNLGSAQMEFLTSENSKETNKVRITLKDEDGNLLSTGYLSQRTGPVVNIGSYALARINPGENILTEPIILQVPESAPYKVIIEAEISNTYYHYGKPEQVTAPGMRQTIETTISVTSYSAEAEPAQTFYGYVQPVVITGYAFSNIPPYEGGSEGGVTPMPNVPVKIGISVKGFDRFYTVTTDSQGNFSYMFNPGATEAGVYSLWAVHPDVTTRSVQATFTIAGLQIDHERVNVTMAKDRTVDIPVKLTNTGGAPLTGLQFEIETSTGITAGVVNEVNTLASGGTATITLRISSSASAPNSGYTTLIITTAEGANARVDALITLVTAIPVISTKPAYIDAGMVRGDQKIATFTITNTGEETLKNARIEGPSTAWMTLTINKEIGDIKPGASITVGILFSPPDTLAQAVYDDSVVIYSDNHIPYTYHIQVTVTSSNVGNVLFDVLNEFMEDVPNASGLFTQHSAE
jgi:large repetitive protein